jgi:DNA-directed RNA polymerase subunit M/transcription elongation factor TFIIS
MEKSKLEICAKCGKIMKPINGDSFKCINCGFKIKGEDLIETEKILKKKIIKEGVVKDKNIFADYPFKCRKCGFDKSEIIERPPYFSDEDSLVYLKCGKCGWTESLSKKIK